MKSNFYNNDAFVGAAIYAGSFDDTYRQQTFGLNLSGLMVRNNRCDKCSTNPDKDIQGAAIYANQVSNVDVSESEFYCNGPKGAIEIRGGKLHFYGTIKFEGNRGDEGGAVSLSQNSKLYFHKNCYVNFIKNTATRVGGAIYIDGDSLVSRQSRTLSGLINMNSMTHSYSYCSIQFIGNSNTSTMFSNNTMFSDNTAQEAGNSVYATPIYNCWLQEIYIAPSLDDYMRLFGIRKRNEIASFPVTVEVGLCKPGTNCNRSSDGRLSLITSYPGKVIRFSATTLDLANVSSPSSVYATVSSEKIKLGSQEYVSWVNTPNSTLEYHVYGPENTSFALLLSTSRGNVPTIVNVTLLPCGLGFSYRADNNSCECSTLYQSHSVSCNIAGGTLIRTATQWLGMHNGKTALVETCPSMYCRDNNVNNTLSSNDLYNDVICNGNRMGPICGKCREGFSLGFGSSNCVDHCTNTWLATILFYVAVGAALVIILFIFNLTVTHGTLYGLIFYANILIVNRDTLVSSEQGAVMVIFYFVSLDLGFIGQPLCFFKGMNQVTKTGLQLVFPVYLVLLVCAVFFICKYCCSYTTGIKHGRMKGCLNSAGQFIGGRVTGVIATLLYLSYSSLLRTAIEILSPAKIMMELDVNVTSAVTVWLYDGSIQYAQEPQHAGLIAAAVVFLIVLLLYTGILTLMPLAETFSGHSTFLLCISSVFNRHLKPFTDTCYGPFKGKWRVWLGLRLWVFVILYGITAAYGSDNRSLVFCLHSLIMTALISLQAYIRPLCRPCTNDDKGWMYNCLDLFFLIDYLLIVLFAWYYYKTNNTSKHQDIITLLLSLAMIAVLLIVSYHVMFKTHTKIATKISSTLSTFRGTLLLSLTTKPATVIDSPMMAINRCALSNDLREPAMEDTV